MSTVKDKVSEIIDSWIDQSILFTALDVSNTVKKDLPLARHSEVRDFVRDLFPQMQVEGYNRTPINVTLPDGSVREALLYHHLSDSWDLDTKYGDQKRSQTVVYPVAAAKPVVAPSVPVVSVVATVPVAVSAPAVLVPPNTPVTVTDPKQLWDSLFTGTKLFPL